MIQIEIDSQFQKTCPDFKGVGIFADVINTEYNTELWNIIYQTVSRILSLYTLENIKLNAAIQATRVAYKRCGKDPNRYRPSAEALIRRILQKKDLPQINTLVDLINLLSIYSGYSIGGFDLHKIIGKKLKLGIGRKNESYEGISRGILNIEGIPVYRDYYGGIGTPTSDHERTKIDIQTKRLLILINGYDNNIQKLHETVSYAQKLLLQFASASRISTIYY